MKNKVIVVALTVAVIVVIGIIAAALTSHNTVELDSTESSVDMSYYENIRPEEANTYNVMRPTGGYEIVQLSPKEIETGSFLSDKFNEIFPVLFVDDEYILNVSPEEIQFDMSTYRDTSNETTVRFTYTRDSIMSYTLILDKRLQTIDYRAEIRN